MSRAGRHGGTGLRLMPPAGRTRMHTDMIEAMKRILLRDMDSGLDWVRSFYY